MTRRRTSLNLTLDLILPHLRKVRRLSDGSYMACCPAHNDENPSLHLSETPDGRLLWHCFAGCSQEAVLRAFHRLLGIQTARPLAPRRTARWRGWWTAGNASRRWWK